MCRRSMFSPSILFYLPSSLKQVKLCFMINKIPSYLEHNKHFHEIEVCKTKLYGIYIKTIYKLGFYSLLIFSIRLLFSCLSFGGYLTPIMCYFCSLDHLDAADSQCWIKSTKYTDMYACFVCLHNCITRNLAMHLKKACRLGNTSFAVQTNVRLHNKYQ